MKDQLMRTIACGKTARINLYRSGEFEIIFVGQRARMHFHFNKHEKLIYRFQSSYLGASKPIKDCEDNWQNFKQYEARQKNDPLPAKFRRLARWKFQVQPKYSIVEDQIGCITYFRKEEVK